MSVEVQYLLIIRILHEKSLRMMAQPVPSPIPPFRSKYSGTFKDNEIDGEGEAELHVSFRRVHVGASENLGIRQNIRTAGASLRRTAKPLSNARPGCCHGKCKNAWSVRVDAKHN